MEILLRSIEQTWNASQGQQKHQRKIKLALIRNNGEESRHIMVINEGHKFVGPVINTVVTKNTLHLIEATRLLP